MKDLVEDEPQVRAGVVQQLQDLGYKVSSASDGLAGLATVESASPPFDLLLGDLVNPGPMSGKGLATEMARRWPKTKVVFMSGYTEDAVIHHRRLDAGMRLLSKPFRKIDLARTVRQALDGTASSALPSFGNDRSIRKQARTPRIKRAGW